MLKGRNLDGYAWPKNKPLFTDMILSISSVLTHIFVFPVILPAVWPEMTWLTSSLGWDERTTWSQLVLTKVPCYNWHTSYWWMNVMGMERSWCQTIWVGIGDMGHPPRWLGLMVDWCNLLWITFFFVWGDWNKTREKCMHHFQMSRGFGVIWGCSWDVCPVSGSLKPKNFAVKLMGDAEIVEEVDGLFEEIMIKFVFGWIQRCLSSGYVLISGNFAQR